MMIKRGQITIFIVLGMLVLFAFGFLYFISQLQNEAAVEQTRDQVPSRTSLIAFDSYVSSCIESKVHKVFDKLLKQGGVLNKTTGGSSSSLIVEDDSSSSFLRYAIREQRGLLAVPKNYSSSQGLFKKSPSGVPLGLFLTERATPFFGVNTLPLLCERSGFNRFEGEERFSCLPELYANRNQSVQYALEKELALEVASCFSSDLLLRQYDFTKGGDGSVELGLTETEVIVAINTSLSFRGISETRTSLSYTYPLRFKKLYTTGFLLANELTKNFDIDFDNLSSFCPSCFEGMSYELIENFTGSSNLLVLRDELSSISAKHYSDILGEYDNNSVLTFFYLIENRRPYLDNIQDIPRILANDFSVSLEDSLCTLTFSNTVTQIGPPSRHNRNTRWSGDGDEGFVPDWFVSVLNSFYTDSSHPSRPVHTTSKTYLFRDTQIILNEYGSIFERERSYFSHRTTGRFSGTSFYRNEHWRTKITTVVCTFSDTGTDFPFVTFPVTTFDPDNDSLTITTTVLDVFVNTPGDSVANFAQLDNFRNRVDVELLENLPYNSPTPLLCKGDNLCLYTGPELTGSSLDITHSSNPFNYKEMRYFIRINVTDGEKYDYQDFMLELLPRERTS